MDKIEIIQVNNLSCSFFYLTQYSETNFQIFLHEGFKQIVLNDE
jgi:hypothetical protein